MFGIDKQMKVLKAIEECKEKTAGLANVSWSNTQ